MSNSFDSSITPPPEPSPNPANEDELTKKLRRVNEGYDEVWRLLDAMDRLWRRFIGGPTVAEMEGKPPAL